MGNEESRHPKLEIEEEAVEVTDYWTLHYAKNVENNLFVQSAFISQSKASEDNINILKKFAKNLMIHRHPYIVKYLSSWTKNNRFHLITEEVKPLSHTISNQSALQICIGLHNVLSAIIFLHEKAVASHNNICYAAIYVTPEGVWKLGGLEYLMKFSEVTPQYLKEIRVKRYEKGVPPEEDSLSSNFKVNAEAIDKYSFGVLVEEMLKKKNTDEIPCLLEFKDFCKKQLLHSDPEKRISLSEVMNHQFFNHNFIKISRFLCDLPLKTTNEKRQFFRDLADQLSLFPEEIVGCQLASLLLSRVVFLDQDAQNNLLPIILQPKTGETPKTEAFFSEDCFKKYLIPKLLHIFSVRDVQIRLILLNNFHLYCDMFTTEQLKQNILPELLLGIKDVNDHLVSTTLKALSHLVMILGSATVIGGKRAKLFADGKPKGLDLSAATNEGKKEDQNKKNLIQCNSEAPFIKNELPERPSPDGGEDDASSQTIAEVENDTENWSDWDSGDKDSLKMGTNVSEQRPVDLIGNLVQIEKVAANKSLPDIDSLDIKNTTTADVAGSEVNFFRDMEPVISKTQILSIKSSKTIFDVESDEVASNWECWEGDWEQEKE